MTVYGFMVGGLGNRFFIAASGYGIAHNRGHDYRLLGHVSHPHSTDNYQWLMERFGGSSSQPFPEPGPNVYREPDSEGLRFHAVPIGEENCYIYGIYQSEQYFDNFHNEIRSFLRAPTHLLESISNRQGALSSKIALHIRVGDYLKSKKHFIPLEHYYEQAMKMAVATYGADVEFLVFAVDMAQARSVYPQVFDGRWNISVFEDTAEDEALYSMSLCRGVICANSTFSWWAAWLNEMPGKFVTIPGKWLNDRTDIVPMKDAILLNVS